MAIIAAPTKKNNLYLRSHIILGINILLKKSEQDFPVM
jgi:hypothetical protein